MASTIITPEEFLEIRSHIANHEAQVLEQKIHEELRRGHDMVTLEFEEVMIFRRNLEAKFEGVGWRIDITGDRESPRIQYCARFSPAKKQSMEAE